MSHTISGNIGPIGGGAATLPIPANNLGVSWSGFSSGSTTTDANGNYSIPGLADGTYTVTPDRSIPLNKTVVVAGADMPGINFLMAAGMQGVVKTLTAGQGGVMRGEIQIAPGGTLVDFSFNDLAGNVDTTLIFVGANVWLTLAQQLVGGTVQLIYGDPNDSSRVTGAQAVGGTLVAVGNAAWVSPR